MRCYLCGLLDFSKEPKESRQDERHPQRITVMTFNETVILISSRAQEQMQRHCEVKILTAAALFASLVFNFQDFKTLNPSSNARDAGIVQN